MSGDASALGFLLVTATCTSSGDGVSDNDEFVMELIRELLYDVMAHVDAWDWFVSPPTLVCEMGPDAKPYDCCSSLYTGH